MVYFFRIEYQRTEDFGNAYGFRRLPLKFTNLFDQQNLGMREVVKTSNDVFIMP